MVRKLRIRFVGICMLILTLLLVGVLGGIYLLMARSEAKESEMLLAGMLDHHNPPDAPKQMRDAVLADVDASYQVLSAQYTYTDTAYESLLPELAEAAVNQPEKSGCIASEGMEFRYMYRKSGEGWQLALVNRATENATLQQLRLTFLLIGGVGILVFLLISLLLSRWAIRPAAEAWQHQQNFVADASHELNTPLTVIAANTDVVLANPEASIASQSRWLDYIKDETTRMAQLVADLLFIAKLDAHEIILQYTDFSVSDLLDEMCMELEPTVFEMQKEFVYTIELDVMLHADAARIRMLLQILLDNAVQYTNPHGKIRVRLVRDKQGHVYLMIANTGEGIPRESQARVFDRFYRVDASRARNTGGYGLGLYIAKSIVTLHDGRIGLISEPDRETIFTVVFP